MGIVRENGIDRPAKYVRYVTDLSGNPVTGYPTRRLWDIRKVKGFNVVATASASAVVVAFTSAFANEAKAAYESGTKSRQVFDETSYNESLISWLNPTIIFDIIVYPSSSNVPSPRYDEMQQSSDRIISELSKSGLELSSEEKEELQSVAMSTYAKSFGLGVRAEPQEPNSRYIRSPDGYILDTETGHELWGPGPKY